MITVSFYNKIEDELLEFAVIVSRFGDKWVFCKHKERSTYECPGGRREENESIIDTAKRELWEETGAVKYNLRSVSVYSVSNDIEETFGMLYFAEILEFEELPNFEIERIEFFEELPTKWTYPLIQPFLLEKVASQVEQTLQYENKEVDGTFGFNLDIEEKKKLILR